MYALRFHLRIFSTMEYSANLIGLKVLITSFLLIAFTEMARAENGVKILRRIRFFFHAK